MKRWFTMAALAAPLCAGSALSCEIRSDFAKSSEGWAALGDTATPVEWIASGGNPGGHIRVVDSVSGGVIYFKAPAKFLGNRASAYGRTLSFDLKQEITGGVNQFDDVDVYLSGGGITIAYNTASNPPFNAWGSFTVPIAAGGWTLNSLTGATATEAQIRTVLGSLTDLRIRAEYQTGGDTGYLDTVVLALGGSADLDGDGSVGATDLAVLLGGWGSGGASDINCDGTTDALDLAALLAAWG